MAKSFENSTLAKLWGEDVQRVAAPTTTRTARVIQLPAGANVKQEMVKYYQQHGLESLAKEVGVITSNGEIASGGGGPTTPKGQRYVTVVSAPPNSAGTPIKMTPLKVEQQTPILPKSGGPTTISLTGPVQIVNVTPQRAPQQYVISPQTSTSWSLKRQQPEPASEYPLESSKRSRKSEKGGKGLRHFSMKVCEKVKQKGTTSYNEVADELVSEFTDANQRVFVDQSYDQKNIRRRVYDALNVLMAMNIISKEKKEIRWLGLPTNSAQECNNLEEQKQKSLKRIKLKMQQLQELLIQQIAYKNLVQRNRELERQNKAPAPSSTLPLPFILINTNNTTEVDCSISTNKMEYLFKFSDKFEIHDDIEVLKQLGLALGLEKGPGGCTEEQLAKARASVPKSLEPYVLHMATSTSDLPPGMPPLSSSSSSQFPPKHTYSSRAWQTDLMDGESGGANDTRVGTPSEDYSDFESEASSPED